MIFGKISYGVPLTPLPPPTVRKNNLTVSLGPPSPPHRKCKDGGGQLMEQNFNTAGVLGLFLGVLGRSWASWGVWDSGVLCLGRLGVSGAP